MAAIEALLRIISNYEVRVTWDVEQFGLVPGKSWQRQREILTSERIRAGDWLAVGQQSSLFYLNLFLRQAGNALHIKLPFGNGRFLYRVGSEDHQFPAFRLREPVGRSPNEHMVTSPYRRLHACGWLRESPHKQVPSPLKGKMKCYSYEDNQDPVAKAEFRNRSVRKS